jgi:hypothetical protein
MIHDHPPDHHHHHHPHQSVAEVISSSAASRSVIFARVQLEGCSKHNTQQ